VSTIKVMYTSKVQI